MRVALGIEDHLDAFARRHSALTWKQFVEDHPENWKSTFLRFLNDPVVSVFLNLDGVDVWRGIARAAVNRGGATDWELLQIKQNPEWWPRISWIKGDRNVLNPFL